MTFKDVKIGQRFVFDMDMKHTSGKILYDYSYEKIKEDKILSLFCIFGGKDKGKTFHFDIFDAKIGLILG